MMDRKRTLTLLFKTSAYLLVLLGIVHIALSPVFFRRFGLDVLWFAGTGMGLVFLGNLNLLVQISKRNGFYMMAVTSNIMGLLLMVLILLMNPAPQAWIGVVLLVILMVGSIMNYFSTLKKMINQEETDIKEREQNSAE